MTKGQYCHYYLSSPDDIVVTQLLASDWLRHCHVIFTCALIGQFQVTLSSDWSVSSDTGVVTPTLITAQRKP